LTEITSKLMTTTTMMMN